MNKTSKVAQLDCENKTRINNSICSCLMVSTALDQFVWSIHFLLYPYCQKMSFYDIWHDERYQTLSVISQHITVTYNHLGWCENIIFLSHLKSFAIGLWKQYKDWINNSMQGTNTKEHIFRRDILPRNSPKIRVFKPYSDHYLLHYMAVSQILGMMLSEIDLSSGGVPASKSGFFCLFVHPFVRPRVPTFKSTHLGLFLGLEWLWPK